MDGRHLSQLIEKAAPEQSAPPSLSVSGRLWFFLSPQLVAEANRQAGSGAATEGFTAAWVRGYGSDATDTWVTTDPHPQGAGAVFVSLREQPAPAPVADMSPNMELLVGGQAVTVADVAHWLNADPKQGKKLFKEMQQVYGAQPTMLELAIFSGATMLAPVAASVVAARRTAQGA